MAPVPKRKHSTYRKGKRRTTKKITLAKTIICSNCGKQKFSHLLCLHCK